MQGRPLRGAPVLILSDLICDTLHIRHLSVSELLSNISKVYISPMFTSCAGFFFRLDILLIRAPTAFQKILAQPNQAKKETNQETSPLLDMVPQRFVSARDLICIKNVGCPGPITQIALMRPLLTTTAIVLRVLGIIPLDRRYHRKPLVLGQAFSPPRKTKLSHLVIVQKSSWH